MSAQILSSQDCLILAAQTHPQMMSYFGYRELDNEMFGTQRVEISVHHRKRQMKIQAFLMLAMFGVSSFAEDVPAIRWADSSSGNWTQTNWVSEVGAFLPAPGYPVSNCEVAILSGGVTLSSLRIEGVWLVLDGGAILAVSNSATL